MPDVTVHYNPGAEWQAKRISYFVDGLKNLGLRVEATQERCRISEAPAVLFGTSSFRAIEAVEGEWLLVDRASVGDPEYVTLVWNGHGRRGDHLVPPWADESRWNRLGVELQPPLLGFEHQVLCGQTESYSPKWPVVENWYASVAEATHFRPHPARRDHENPTSLPIKLDFIDSAAHVLNSSIGVECVIQGRPTFVHDEGSMAWGIEEVHGGREEWAHWLAWTQWHWDEIREGRPIEHLFYA